ILSWNCLEYADVYGAAMKGGFIASPFNPRLQSGEIVDLITYSEANTLFVGPELVEMIRPLKSRLPRVKNYISFEGPAPDMVPHSDLLAAYPGEEPDIRVEQEDPYLILYTSGTTGVARGALYTQRRKLLSDRIQAMELGIEPGDKHIMILPLFHIGGATHFWAFFSGGGSNVIMPQRSFSAEATLQAIQDEKATDIHIVPTHLSPMLASLDLEKYDLTCLKRIWYAASPMPTVLLKKAIKAFGPIFLQAYGQSESGPNVCHLTKKSHQVFDRPLEEQKVLASCGQPCIGVHVRIVDENNEDVKVGEVGEIIAQSESLMVEYWKKPKETQETIIDGWLHTGDMGYYDRVGNIYIVDRKKDMIISGGENIYPREVEEILYQHPSVREVAVFGIPDPYWVEKVHAAIVLKEGYSSTSEEMIDFCKKYIARYKLPKSIEFAEALPKNPAGKILKKEMREKYWTGMDRKI
ncbi:MAG: AMP-binding protein, partial [Pseudomonadota bacterium]